MTPTLRGIERKKIIPAVAALEQAVDLGVPIDRCLTGGSAGLARCADELGALLVEMQLSRLSAEEERLFSGPVYADQEGVAQALEAPLERSPEVQEAARVRPEELRQLRGMLGELLRVIDLGQAFLEGTRDARRFVRGLGAFSCLRLVDQLEKDLAGGALDEEQRQALIGETAGLRARVKAFREERERRRAEDDERLAALAEAAEAAEAGVEARRTVERVRGGERPADEEILQAAAHLMDEGPAPPPQRRRRRRRSPR